MSHVKSPMHTLVLGGNGKTGRKIVDLLQRQNVPVRIGSRRGDPSFNWDHPVNWAKALMGMQAVYICFTPDLTIPGATNAIQHLVDTAVSMDVRRLVLLSGRGELEAQQCEEIIKRSGVEWTILSCSWFNQNFSEGVFADPVRSGMVALPVGEIPEPFLDTDDIAAVATAALTQEKHAGKLYELTGPESLTFEQAISIISDEARRPIRFQTISSETYQAELKKEGVPDDFINFLIYLFEEILDGRNASTTDTVEKVLGRPAKSFRQYAKEAAASRIWNSFETV